jgi:hypothetical protein
MMNLLKLNKALEAAFAAYDALRVSGVKVPKKVENSLSAAALAVQAFEKSQANSASTPSKKTGK